MTAVVDAHTHLELFCNNNPGVAIGSEIFTYFVKKAIDTANSRPLTLPTTTSFHGLALEFNGKIDPGSMVVTLDKRPAPVGEAPLPEVTVQEVIFEINIMLAATRMSTHKIRYRRIVGGITVSANKIVINGEQSDGEWLEADAPWRQMQHLPDGTTFTDKLKAEWEVQEKAVELIAKDLLGPTLLQSVELPNVIKMLTSIDFVGPVRVGGEKDLIMFSGPATWEIGCSRQPAHIGANSVQLTTPLNSAGGLAEDGVSGELDPNDPNGRYPRERDTPHLSNADVFVHLPKTFVEKRFDGVAKPATGFNDDGRLGPIYWHYESAIVVQGVKLSMTSLWPLEFKLELPSIGTGVAGAGVKIGCIYYEAMGLAFNGRIDPLEIFFRVGQDTHTSELFFESRYGRVKAHGFQFHHWPNIKFPMDQVADFILARVVEMLISAKAGDVLNVSRFTLIDYAMLRGFGRMLNGMAAQKSSTAVTVGVAFQK